MAIRPLSDQRDIPGWEVRVVPNKFPALQIEGNLAPRGDGIYDIINGIGAHEVVIETPNHASDLTDLSEKNFHDILLIFRNRTLDLKKDSLL